MLYNESSFEHIETFIMKDLIEQVVNKARSSAEQASKNYNGGETTNYAYCFGYTLSDFTSLLNDLQLSDKQAEILMERLK
jgi:hypothetical protein